MKPYGAWDTVHDNLEGKCMEYKLGFHYSYSSRYIFFFFQAEDGIRDYKVTGVQTCALPISAGQPGAPAGRAGRLRRSGTLARQVLLVGRRVRRRTETGATLIVAEPPAGSDIHKPSPARLRRLTGLRGVSGVPVSPAVPSPPGGAPAGPMSIPLLPGERTAVRRLCFAV